MKNPAANKVYLDYVSSVTPKTKHAQRLIAAFVIGGIICMLGQAFKDIISHFYPNMDKLLLSSVVTAIMIFIGSTLTGIGIYDRLGSFAGAGSIVPITGFANSVVSPAMDFKSEGFIYGLAAKMFIIAGPIIVNGIALSSLVGLIYYIIYLF